MGGPIAVTIYRKKVRHRSAKNVQLEVEKRTSQHRRLCGRDEAPQDVRLRESCTAAVRHYWCRNATSGSRLAARRAGRYDASVVTPAIASTTRTNVQGSKAATPKSKVDR